MPKKILLVGLVFILLCSVAPSSQAIGNIKLLVNGQVVTNDLAYQIEDQNILIPLGVLTEALPLKMRWFESISTLRLQLNDRVVKLRLGDTRLQVNNQLVRLPVAVKRTNGKFMVPLNSLGEALGLMIKADQSARVVEIFEIDAKVQDISYLDQEGYQGVEVQATSPVEPKLDYLQNPDRIILDLPATKLARKFKQLKTDSQLIKGVRVAQFDPTTVRVVVDLAGQAHYRLLSHKSGGGYNYLIKVNSVVEKVEYTEEGLQITGTGRLQPTAPVHLTKPDRIMVDIKNAVLANRKVITVDDPYIKEIRVSQYKSKPNPIVRAVLVLNRELDLKVVSQAKEVLLRPILAKFEGLAYDDQQPSRVAFKLSQQQQPRAISLKEGNRLVFDFSNTVNKSSTSKLAVNNSLIEEIRVGQFNRNTTRAVVDLKELVPYQTNWKNGTFNVKLMNKLQQVKVVDKKAAIKVDVSLLGQGSYQVHKLYHPQRLVIDIKDTVVNKQAVNLINNSKLARDIRVSQYTNNPNITRVVVDLKENFNFAVQSPTTAQQIAVKVNKRNLAGKVIVLDPGHGGDDPGALGPSGTREKNVVLDIAKDVAKLLEKAGAKVVMTRKKDNFIPLPDRVEIANRLNADLLVSIHANGHQTDNPAGTETFVKVDSDRQSQFLGHFVQQELVKNLETYNRKVKEDGLYVLENSEVPAILSEVAFITNPTQEKLLTSNQFRFNASVGFYEGISKYFKWLAEEES